MKTIPDRLCLDGFRFVLIRPGQKRPFEKDWPKTANYRHDDQRLLAHLASGGNYGVVGGYGALVILDADKDCIVEATRATLPETFSVKTGGGGQHFYYLSDLKVPLRLFDEDGENIGDVQGEGKQCVGPGSLHPNGHRYEIVQDIDVARITEDELRNAVQPWLVKTQAAKKYPKKKWDGIDTLGITDVVPMAGLQDKGDQSQGPHPIHGSETGQNFSVNRRKNVWHCFRHSSGGGPLDWIAVQHGIIDCSEALPGALTGEKFWQVLEAAEKSVPGFTAPRPPETKTETKPKGKTKAEKTGEEFKLAQELMVEYSFLTTDDNEELWVYKSEGVWKPEGELLVKRMAEEAFQDDCTVNRAKEVIGHIVRSTYSSRKLFDSREELINLENGALDISGNPPELVEHDADHFFTWRLPVRYDPDAEAPAIEKFLEEVSREGDRQTLKEFIAYCLVPGYPIHQSLMLTAEGENGKSTFIGLVERFLGKENCSHVSIQELCQFRFQRAELFGKIANLYADVLDEKLVNTGTWKMATGGDTLMGEKKYKGRFPFKNRAKMIFSANKVPETTDDTDAFFRRWTLIDFPNKFTGKKKDPFKLEKISTDEELSGLLNICLELLPELRKGFFTVSKTTEEKRELFIHLAHPVEAFRNTRLVQDARGYLTKHEVYQAYVAYCDERVLPALDNNIFARKLKKYIPVESGQRGGRGKQVYVWNGVGWKEEEEDDPDPQEKLD